MQALVKKEAANLKKNASKEEIGKLRFDLLVPANTNKCIYGQMTGFCYSIRANDLIKNCAERVYKNNGRDYVRELPLNGKPTFLRSDSIWRAAQYYSPIEVFILQPGNQENGNNERLIKYLKGETKTLKFK